MKGKRIVSLLLCLVLTLGLLPMSVFAAEGNPFKLMIVENAGAGIGNVLGGKISISADGTEIKKNEEITKKAGITIQKDAIPPIKTGQEVVVTATAPDGYLIEGADFYSSVSSTGAPADKNKADVTLTIKCSDDKKSAEITFTLTDEQLKQKPKPSTLAIKLKLDGHTVTFYPYASDETHASKSYHTTVKKDETLSEPTPEEIQTKAPAQNGYFDIMEIEGWYTDTNFTKRYTFGSPLTEDINLYAKVKLKKDAKISVEYRVSIKEKPNDPSTYDRSAYYNLEKKRFSFENPGLTINVGTPVTGLPIGETITSNDLGLPKSGLTITGWVLVDPTTGKTTPYEEGKNAITAEQALKLLKDDKVVAFWAAYTGTSVVSFNNNGKGAAAPADMKVPFVWNGNNGKNPTLTNEQRQTLTNWTATQEANTDYFFRGWYTNEQCTGDAWVFGLDEGKIVNGFWNDTTLYAKWVEKKTVTFDTNGKPTDWTGNQLVMTVGAGDKLTAPTAPEAGDKSVFLGWYKDPACKDGQQWNFDTDTISDNTTLYAKWSTETRRITMKFRKLDPDDTTDATWTDVTTYKDVPVVANYTFGRGNTVPKTPAENSGTKNLRTLRYADSWTFVGKGSQTYTLNANTILADCIDDAVTELVVTAEATPYITVTFDAQGGQFKNNTDKFTTDLLNAASGAQTAAPAADPTKSGYRFGGWYKDTAKSDEFKPETDTFRQNTTIYAKWNEIPSHEITFEVTDKQSKTQITDAQITVKNGNGEPQEPNASGVYTLKEGAYDVTVRANGYKTASSQLDVTAETQKVFVELEAFVAVKDIALSLSQVMKTKEYALSDYLTITPAAATRKDVTWSAAETLPAGVTLADGKLTVTADAAENAQIKLSATIANGALNADGKTEQNYTKDFTLTVTKYLATITFAHGTGDHPDITLPEKKTVNEDTTLTAPADPSDDNWTFKGWFKDAACTQAWQTTDTFAADATLYAKWELKAIKVTLTFNGGDGTQKNSGVENTLTLDSGTTIKLPACMFTKDGYIFSAWQQDGESGSIVADTSYKVPRSNVTFTAKWTEIAADTSVALIEQSIKGITEDNASKYQPQLFAARDAAHTNPDAGKNADLRANLETLFRASGIANPTVSGNAATGTAQGGAILSSNGQTVTLTIDKGTAATLPSAYQNEEYKSAWRTITMKHGSTALTEPLVPVLVTMPVPDELSGMAADTIRVLVYDGSAEPTVMEPTVTEDGKLTFSVETLGQYALVGKAISDAADTRVTALVMKYNDKVMGNVKQDDNGNFTVTFPSSMNQTAIDDLSFGTGWKTYLTVAPHAKVATVENTDGWNAQYWAETGVALQFDLSGTSATDTITLTAIAQNGTERTFTVTAKKITDADRTYKIAVANISGGTVTAKPNPAAAGEEVKLTIEPNDGKKLVAGSLKYSLQSAGAAPVAIDESTLTFIMPAGDININAQFEDDANAPLKNPPQITAFVVNGVSAVINSDTKAITIILPYGTDLKHVAPTIVTANASKVVPSSAQRVDLSTPKAYRVYASNGAYVTYTVTAYTEEPSPTQSLWEKLQNQINSNPNWWELAEYQKKSGYYR